MKTVLLVTLHSQNNNFGSVIQGHSLYSYVKNLGYDVSVLDYRPNYSNGATDFKSRIKRFAANMLFLPQFLIRNRRFSEFISMEKLTSRYTTYQELKDINMKYDIFLIGSDQVWNSEHNCGKDPAYYLEFTQSSAKIAYAASLGRYIKDENVIETLITNISKFRSISLRENRSVVQLTAHGMANVQYVLDPVFLFDVNHYRIMQVDCKESGYILAYIIHSDPLIAQVIKEIARKLNKKVIQIGGLAAKCKYDKYRRDAGPREFLSLVDNADFVVTSSFHGTAFSLIYEKPFAVVMPHSNTLRLENILETAGLTNRVVNTMDDITRMLEPVDYSDASKKIAAMRQISQKYLTKALDDGIV
ncbi:MAG: polysaccharide pyruvyl transferase family protein [Sphaerochaeta sp.]|uniref:polysaccharide pyruvyl transferase family protein n=1 Tax=Sphaerochaeta sp. TaxID=1972642 RepID=UPI003D0E8764